MGPVVTFVRTVGWATGQLSLAVQMGSAGPQRRMCSAECAAQVQVTTVLPSLLLSSDPSWPSRHLALA